MEKQSSLTGISPRVDSREYLINTREKPDINTILQLIDVHPPYFALHEVRIYPDQTVSASVQVEQPAGYESGPVSCSEASRHMAILGSVSCAFANPVKSKHFYLASEGSYHQISAIAASAGNVLTIQARCIYLDKRNARAQCRLLDTGNNLIAEIMVSFHVVAYPVFERLYKLHYKSTPDFSVPNPYLTKNELLNIRCSSQQASASLGIIKDQYCAGHFPYFPALPVAILMNSLLDLAVAYIQFVMGAKSFRICVKKLELIADNLGFAGERLHFFLDMVTRNGNIFVLTCYAITDTNKKTGEINTEIEVAVIAAE